MTRLSSAIVTNRVRILLFLRDSRPAHDPNRWSLIGGHVERSETLGQALVREVEEEIGIRLRAFRFLLRLPGHWGEDIALYHIPPSDAEASRIRLGNEGQKVEFIALGEVARLPLTANLAKLFNQHRGVFEEVTNAREST
jgi:8-oxo-dGTP diphosphatase